MEQTPQPSARLPRYLILAATLNAAIPAVTWLITQDRSQAIAALAVTVLATVAAAAASKFGGRIFSPVALVGYVYGIAALVGFLGTASVIMPGRLSAQIVWVNLTAIAAFAAGWLAGTRMAQARQLRRPPALGAGKAVMTNLQLARLVLLVAAAGATYVFRHGIPLFTDINARFDRAGGALETLATVAYDGVFVGFLLLLPSCVGPWKARRVPWIELAAVVVLTGIEGNRRFAILFLCALLYAIWSGVRVNSVALALAAVVIGVLFSVVGQLREPQATLHQRLEAIHYDAPAWTSAAYLAFRSSDDVVMTLVKNQRIRDDPGRPRPLTLAGPAEILPGHQESPDFWARAAILPHSDQSSGLNIPLTGSLYVDGSYYAVALAYLMLGAACAWCRNQRCAPLTMLFGVALATSVILGAYGTFLGTPIYVLTFAALACIGIANRLLPRLLVSVNRTPGP